MNPTDGARRNLARYPWFVGGLAAHAWVPVFFLYLSSRVTLAEVLALEAIYYAAVVLVELPSGYFSDRIGRRPTLTIAALAVLAAHITFGLGETFGQLAAAQVCLAIGLAFNSGTDTSLHLASLTAAGLDDEYGEREARMATLTFGLGAASALVGGALGTIDMRLAYAASAVGALVALVAAVGFRPIPRRASTDGQAGFGAAIGECLSAARRRPLAWLFGVSVVGVVTNHIPYEFYQPYLDALPQRPWPDDGTPLIAGVHAAAVALLATLAARYSARASARWGLAPYLIGSVALQALLVGAMALFTHPLVAVALVARSVPPALQSAPMRAHIAPYLRPGLRATYLSLQSLAGRLAFAGVLLGLSRIGHDLESTLIASAVVPIVLLAVLVATARGATAPPAS